MVHFHITSFKKKFNLKYVNNAKCSKLRRRVELWSGIDNLGFVIKFSGVLVSGQLYLVLSDEMKSQIRGKSQN